MVISIDDAVELVAAICRLPSNADFELNTRYQAERAGLPAMVQSHNTAGLFRWLMDCFSYQGISDRRAADYIGTYGNASYEEVALLLGTAGPPSCPKLAGFDAYHGCGYRKTARGCANPDAMPSCPVPLPNLRKGDLNQLAFSLFFFLRDRCGDDLVGFIDRVFLEADPNDGLGPIDARRIALVNAFSGLHAVSAKLINMSFATLLIAGDENRPDWIAVGRSMVAIDTLVHNFLHRTGILAVFDSAHSYGPRCYGPAGCAAIIYDLTGRIVATGAVSGQFAFPRLVQFAIWSFCAEGRLDVCNGRQIDDNRPCGRNDCPVGHWCGRQPLRASKPLMTRATP